MTEEELKAAQAKHRREAEEIRAGIKARKKRLSAVFRAGESFESRYRYGEYSVDDIRKIAEYAAELEETESFALRVKKEGL